MAKSKPTAPTVAQQPSQQSAPPHEKVIRPEIEKVLNGAPWHQLIAGTEWKAILGPGRLEARIEEAATSCARESRWVLYVDSRPILLTPEESQYASVLFQEMANRRRTENELPAIDRLREILRSVCI